MREGKEDRTVEIAQRLIERIAVLGLDYKVVWRPAYIKIETVDRFTI